MAGAPFASTSGLLLPVPLILLASGARVDTNLNISSVTSGTADEWWPVLQELAVLGAGSFGKVSKVRTTCSSDTRILALKFIRGDVKLEEESFKFMLNERYVMASLEHPNIAEEVDFLPKKIPQRNLLDFFGWFSSEKWDGNLAILMEYFPGNSLSKSFTGWPYWRNGIDMRVKQAIFVTIGGQLLSGLAYMHHKGFLHLDLKTGNLFLKTPNTQCLEEPGTCVAKLGDFGLSCWYGSRSAAPWWANLCGGSKLGTPAYMAPEQHLKDAPAANPKMDAWQMGVILLELWNGAHPFVVNGRIDDLDQLQRRASQAPLSGLPDRFSNVIRGLLAYNAKDRLSVPDAKAMWDRAAPPPPPFQGILNEELRHATDPQLPRCFHACLQKVASGDGCGSGFCWVTDGDKSSLLQMPRGPHQVAAKSTAVAALLEVPQWPDPMRRASPSEAPVFVQSRMKVYYWSTSGGRWTRATVIGRNKDDGTYQLDVNTRAPVTKIWFFAPGAYVEYWSSSQHLWIPARVADRNQDDGTYRLLHASGNEVLHEHGLVERIRLQQKAALQYQFAVGMEVEYFSRTSQEWMPATITDLNDDGTYCLDVVQAAPAERIRIPQPLERLPQPESRPAVQAPEPRPAQPRSVITCQAERCGTHQYYDVRTRRCASWCSAATDGDACNHGSGTCHGVMDHRRSGPPPHPFAWTGMAMGMTCIDSAPDAGDERRPCRGGEFNYGKCIYGVQSFFGGMFGGKAPGCGCGWYKGYYGTYQMECSSHEGSLDMNAEGVPVKTGLCQFMGH